MGGVVIPKPPRPKSQVELSFRPPSVSNPDSEHPQTQGGGSVPSHLGLISTPKPPKPLRAGDAAGGSSNDLVAQGGGQQTQDGGKAPQRGFKAASIVSASHTAPDHANVSAPAVVSAAAGAGSQTAGDESPPRLLSAGAAVSHDDPFAEPEVMEGAGAAPGAAGGQSHTFVSGVPLPAGASLHTQAPSDSSHVAGSGASSTASSPTRRSSGAGFKAAVVVPLAPPPAAATQPDGAGSGNGMPPSSPVKRSSAWMSEEEEHAATPPTPQGQGINGGHSANGVNGAARQSASGGNNDTKSNNLTAPATAATEGTSKKALSRKWEKDAGGKRSLWRNWKDLFAAVDEGALQWFNHEDDKVCCAIRSLSLSLAIPPV